MEIKLKMKIHIYDTVFASEVEMIGLRGERMRRSEVVSVQMFTLMKIQNISGVLL